MIQRSKQIALITLLSPFLILLNLTYFYELPILSKHRNTLRKITSNIYPNLNYVALGTSVTWGQGLDNRETQTYIKLLSPSSLNLAIRASDATYASLCTQSLLGTNENYDVIIIEYERRYEEGLELLVKRLRQRYPHAIIILTDIWTFMNIYVLQNNDKSNIIPFVAWLKSNGITKNEREAFDFVFQSTNAKFIFSKWLFERSEYLKMMGDKYGVVVHSWDKSDGDVKDLILRYLPLYHRDFIHLSELGHEHTANNIRNIVRRENIKRLASFSRASEGDWGDGDFCSFWVNNGVVPNTTIPLTTVNIPSVIRNNKIEMIKFDKQKHKYALQFPFQREETHYKLQIINPFNESRMMSIAYMATGPNSTIYPLTQVTIFPQVDDARPTSSEKDVRISQLINKWEEAAHSKDKQSKVINPIVQSYNYPVHVQLVSNIGQVRPGRNDIEIEPLRESNAPFRLVGFAITNDQFVLSKIFERASPLEEE